LIPNEFLQLEPQKLSAATFEWHSKTTNHRLSLLIISKFGFLLNYINIKPLKLRDSLSRFLKFIKMANVIISSNSTIQNRYKFYERHSADGHKKDKISQPKL
jgi:hypothetical protein